MSYKLKKNVLIVIAEYIIINKDRLSDHELINNFYEMLMNSLDDTKIDSTESSYDDEEYIEIHSDEEP